MKSTKIFRPSKWYKLFQKGSSFAKRPFDRRVAIRDFPFLRDFDPWKLESSTYFQARHKDYVNNYSESGWAVSFQTSMLLLRLCEALEPKRIVDFGSGFSSYLLRFYAQDKEDVVVCSVDDDADWLRITREYVNQNSLPPDNIMLIHEFISTVSHEKNFDLIFHDIGRDYRWQLVDELLNLVAPESGIILFDDTHRVNYRRYIIKRVLNHDGRFVNLAAFTQDDFNRYAGLAYQIRDSGKLSKLARST